MRFICGRPGRERLRRPRGFAGHVAARNRTFFDWPHRLARDAIEHERKPLFGQLHDRVDPLAVNRDRHKIRSRRRIVVPQTVMHDLVVPLALAGIRIEADDRLGEQVLPGSPAAVVIVARRADRHVEQAARFIEAHRRPHVGVAGELPGPGVPGVIAELATLRNGVELPHQLSSPRVKCTHVTGRIVLVGEAIADAVADDDQILVDDGWRGVGVVLLVDRPDQALAEIDDAVLAEG